MAGLHEIVPAEKALLDALRSSREPPLAYLHVPMYPHREFRSTITPEGYIAAKINKHGSRGYKMSRYRTRQQSMVHIVPDAICDVLNEILPNQFRVITITDEGEYINVIMEAIL